MDEKDKLQELGLDKFSDVDSLASAYKQLEAKLSAPKKEESKPAAAPEIDYNKLAEAVSEKVSARQKLDKDPNIKLYEGIAKSFGIDVSAASNIHKELQKHDSADKAKSVEGLLSSDESKAALVSNLQDQGIDVAEYQAKINSGQVSAEEVSKIINKQSDEPAASVSTDTAQKNYGRKRYEEMLKVHGKALFDPKHKDHAALKAEFDEIRVKMYKNIT